jgi:predicted AAA+ superfamily ATPase
MNFKEFLLALNEGSLLNYIENYQFGQQIPSAIHNKLLHALRRYFFVGGMPEAVKVFSETKSFLDIKRIHESIIKSFEFDFSKYRTRNQEIIANLLRYVPKSTGQKFKYVNFDNNLRAESIKKVLNLLNMSRIIHIIYSTNASGLPLEEGVSGKVFKLLFMDIGLLNHILGLSLTNTDDLVTINEGKLAEQFIGQELLQDGAEFTEKKVYYWTREKRNAEAKIDFLTQSNNKIVPIEVKAGKTGRLKSLHVFAAEKKINQAVRFNADFPSTTTVETQIKIEKQMKNVKFKLVSLPLYLVSEFQRLL